MWKTPKMGHNISQYIFSCFLYLINIFSEQLSQYDTRSRFTPTIIRIHEIWKWMWFVSICMTVCPFPSTPTYTHTVTPHLTKSHFQREKKILLKLFILQNGLDESGSVFKLLSSLSLHTFLAKNSFSKLNYSFSM